jgi:branched-chain amino acid transport system ATP-binding protein
MLSVQKITVGYAAGPVVWDIDLVVNPGEIVTLIGANGAGKSTIVKTISGLLRPVSGRISYQGKQIESATTGERVRLGISHVPEGRQVFAGLSVAENLRLGAYVHRGALAEENLQIRIKKVCNRFPVLLNRMDEIVGNFSGGQQQMLAIARGLMADPELLILDEPSLGLSPLLVSEIFALIKILREQGLAVLLSEQNARSALAISDRGYVIESGRVSMSGPAHELLNSSEIIDRYLGVGGVNAVSSGKNIKMAAQLRELIWNEPARI